MPCAARDQWGTARDMLGHPMCGISDINKNGNKKKNKIKTKVLEES